MARAEPQPPEGGTTNAKLFDSGFDRVGGFAVHCQPDADFASRPAKAQAEHCIDPSRQTRLALRGIYTSLDK